MNAAFDQVGLAEQLRAGCSELHLSISGERQALLLEYLRLLHKWNRAFNLTAIRQPQAMLIRHVLDSLALLPVIRPGQCLDVGTGPGLPGLILALTQPDLHWTLLDSNGKKTRFLTQVRLALALRNVDVVQSRVESYLPPHSFDTVTCRAVGRLAEWAILTRRLLASGGCLWAMKGVVDTEEIRECADLATLIGVHRLKVPGLNAERHVVEVRWPQGA